MSRFNRLAALGLVLAGALTACMRSEPPTALQPAAQLELPGGHSHSEARIVATDSLMLNSNTSYSDTAQVAQRLQPLASDLSVTATIGTGGGELRIDAAGVRVIFPGGALSSPTTVTLTAVAGSSVVYEFQPHGLVFKAPVRVLQDLRVTNVAGNSLLTSTVHGAYFDTTLSDAFVDAGKQNAKVKEHELGYLEAGGQQLRFHIGHFSGYMLACGRGMPVGGE